MIITFIDYSQSFIERIQSLISVIMDSESCDNVFASSANATQLFQDGDSVLVRVGVREPLQQAVVVQNDVGKCQCLVKTRGGSSFWVAISAMSHDDSENDIICHICGSGVSEAPDFIILCDKCGKGFHQVCHEPAVGEMYVDSDLQWFCSSCHPQVASGDTVALLAQPALHVPARPSSSSAVRPVAPSCGPYQFPYKLESLHWGDGHRENWEKTYCYCGQKGSWNVGMIQCVSCLQWFHEECLKSVGPLSGVVGCRFRTITCAVCTQASELRHRYAFQWIDVALLVFYNLTSVKHCFENGRRRTWLDFWVDIIPFAEKHWSLFAWGDKKYTADEKHCSMLKALLERSDLFVNGRDCNKRMTLFRFHDKRTHAPQPDTKVAHHQSPIPYSEQELPTASNLFRFTLSSDKSPEIPGQKRKRAPRSWPQNIKPVPVDRFKSAQASDDEDDGGSPGSKRAFVLPTEQTSESPGSVVSSSGRLLIIPQGCARKSVDNGVDQDCLSSPSPPHAFLTSPSSVQLSSSKLKVSSQSAFFPSQAHSSHSPPATLKPSSAVRAELAPIRPTQHGSSSPAAVTGQRSHITSAAGVQRSSSTSAAGVQRSSSTSAAGVQRSSSSTSATGSLHRSAGGTSATAAAQQISSSRTPSSESTSSSRTPSSESTQSTKPPRTASTASSVKREIAKSPLTMTTTTTSIIAETLAMKSHDAPQSHWMLDKHRLPYKVLGVRTLPDGQQQYLLDWYVRA